jgi:hypothetical protein
MTRSNMFTAVVMAASLAGAAALCQADEPQKKTDGKAEIVLGGKGPAGTDQGKPAADDAARAKDPKKTTDQPVLRTTAQKRQWLRRQAAVGLRDKAKIQQLQARIDRLTPQQVDAMMNAVLAQQLPEDQQQQLLQQAQLELYRAQLLQQAMANEWWWRNNGGAVGFMPVITWLPEGTSFGAGAVISPDGRYVRVSSSPFFSSVGPVYTYNLATGETRPWPPYGSYPYYGSQPSAYPPYAVGVQPAQRPQQSQPRVWHDGLRTRVGP